MSLSTIKQLAIAVLSDDKDAIKALFDLVAEEYSLNATPILPTKKITVDSNRVRVALIMRPNARPNNEMMEQIGNWLEGRAPANLIALNGVDRIEIYEMPEGTQTQINGTMTLTEEQLQAFGNFESQMEDDINKYIEENKKKAYKRERERDFHLSNENG